MPPPRRARVSSCLPSRSRAARRALQFLTLMQNQGGGKGQDAQKLLETFQKFDIDGDGTLTRLELTTIIGSMAEKLSDVEIEELVDEVVRARTVRRGARRGI